jgi:hypothetical protein
MVDDQKSWRRVSKFTRAERVEWHRILESPKLKRDIQDIQANFGLPLSSLAHKPLFENPAYVRWIGWADWKKTGRTERPEKLRTLIKEVSRLVRGYRIPPQYFGSLWNSIMTGREGPSYQSGGFPAFRMEKTENGEWEHLCIVTPETDLRNPLVLKSILDWQLKVRTSPPKPRRAGRRTDWRPVWEWHNRNPEVTDQQIARMLGHNRVTVARAFERLDQEFATDSD